MVSMILTLPRFLFGTVLLLGGVDVAWALAAPFRVDGPAYLRWVLMSLGLLAVGLYYQRRRGEPQLAAMALGTSFLIGFSAVASVLNYFLLTVAGTRIDAPLASLDRAVGFDWPRAFAWLMAHPVLNMLAFAAYTSMLPQVAVLIIVLATIEPAHVMRFCAALALGALICIAIWVMAPSFGAFSVYGVHAPHTLLALDGAYAHDLVRLLKDGPGLVSPADTKGLIGFPSYHAVMALLAIRFAWPVRWLRWPVVVLNLAVLLATPLQGGHHLIDVLAAWPVTLVALAGARALDVQSSMVKETQTLSIKCFITSLFVPLRHRLARRATNSD